MTGAGQLALALGHRRALGREDYLVSPVNAAAVGWVDRWPRWPGQSLVLFGPAACGKTHLAHVFAGRADARFAAPADLAEGAAGPAGGYSLVVEDAATFDARGLLRLLNRHCGTLLVTSREPPARWRAALPDLTSRLAALPTVEIGPPDDALLAGVFLKLFHDRQVRIRPEVVTYMVTRLERSFAAVARAAAALDEVALARGRAPSIPMARQALARLAAEAHAAAGLPFDPA